MSQYIQEAFKKFDLLEEEDFNLDASGMEELKSFLDDDVNDFENIIDPEAETEEELEDSYVGKVILECKVCHSKIYKDATEVDLDEATELANEGEECPFCYSMDGFSIIGQVAPFQETEVKVDVEPKEDEVEVTTEESEDESLEEGIFDKEYYVVTAGKDDKEVLKTKDKNQALKKAESIPFAVVTKYTRHSSETVYQNVPKDESLKESAGQDVSEYQKWVDYDMKKYDKISDDTMETIKKAGLSVVKDQYGDYEVIADRKDESLDEALENIDVETEHDKIHIEAEEKQNSGEEMIAPIEPAQEADIVSNEDSDSEDSDEDDYEEFDLSEFDEESFDTMGESYLKKVYGNVESFKTSKVSTSGNTLMIEGVIKFNSGKEKSTTFKFEAKDFLNNKVRFIGENLQISKGKKSFALRGTFNESKFISESLNYNYRVNGNRVYGTVKNESLNESDVAKKKIDKLNNKKREKEKLANKYANKKTPGEVCISEAKDLSSIEGSMTKILVDNKDAINRAASKEELISTLKSLLKDVNTPASKRLIMNAMKQKSLNSALQTVYNSMLAGSNLAVDRK